MLNIKPKHKILKRVLITFGTFAILLTGVFFIYTADYYKADPQATAIFATAETGHITVKTDGDLTILTPANPNGNGLIFYPGGKVEETAYLPLLEKLSNQGITCVLIKMPFHLAVFGVNKADEVFGRVQGVDKWYIGGHSLGGAMAGSYASSHQDKIAGLILLGAYIYGDYPKDKAITIYGSNDKILDRSKINYNENVSVIDGGNHGQFGNYGRQKGDGTATIDSEEQQHIAVTDIYTFMQNEMSTN